jgi:hypothetical protein
MMEIVRRVPVRLYSYLDLVQSYRNYGLNYTGAYATAQISRLISGPQHKLSRPQCASGLVWYSCSQPAAASKQQPAARPEYGVLESSTVQLY